MVEMYVVMVIKNLLTVEQIPERYKKDVIERLSQYNKL